jgi:hypothetical protein
VLFVFCYRYTLIDLLPFNCTAADHASLQHSRVFSLLRQVRRACVRSPFRFVGRCLPFGLFLHDASHADGRRRRKVCDRLVFDVIVEESPYIYIYIRRQSAIVVGIE